MKLAAFKYSAPDSLEEALGILSQSEAGKILAGGQSLLPQLISRQHDCDWLVDIQNISEFNTVEKKQGHIAIAAMTRQRDVELNSRIKQQHPLLCHMLGHIGSIAIRNRGTVVGSLCHGASWGEIPLLFVLLGGSLVVQSQQGKREIPADTLFISHNRTALAAKEMAIAAYFSLPNTEYYWGYCEYSQRAYDRALCLAAVTLRIDHRGRLADVRIAVGGVTAIPQRCGELETRLTGEIPAHALAVEAGRVAAIQTEVTDDGKLATAYRRQLLSTLVCRALLQAFSSYCDRYSGGNRDTRNCSAS
ncbi:FAD binding domain-containing protein [Serratia sp. NPDC078593]|uniref:FAD binding domain-containing protein n=1 Tax=unclassified Serratia (in: enterobacteria) TaxID=2647522 RepID=UPI0037D6C59A